MCSNSSTSRTSTSPPVKYIAITPSELQSLYDENAMKFDRDIKGKNVAVTGVVSEITSTTVKLRVKNYILFDTTITCEISQTSKSYVADNFKVGNTVTLYGKVSGPTLSAILDDFVITDCSAIRPRNAVIVETDS